MQVLVLFINASKYFNLVDKSDPVFHFEIFALIFFFQSNKKHTVHLKQEEQRHQSNYMNMKLHQIQPRN